MLYTVLGIAVLLKSILYSLYKLICLNPLAFISHSEGGKTTSDKIRNHLTLQPVNLECFYSMTDIGPEDYISEKIMSNITNTDVWIGVIDLSASVSMWVEWEHNFCRERNIIRIFIILPSVLEDFEQNRIPFVTYDRNVIIYNYDSDIMLDKLASTIRRQKNDLDKNVEEKEKIEITLDPLKNNYYVSDIITISGRVKSAGIIHPEFNSSKIYLHRRNFTTGGIPMISKKIQDPITLNSDGKFSHSFKLSEICNAGEIQKWFFEVRFGNKSVVTSTEVCPSNNDTNDTPPPKTSNTVESDPFGPLREKIRSVSSGTASSIYKQIDGHTIDRKHEIFNLLEKIEEYDRVVITGDKGSGKSTMLCTLYEQLKENTDILFVRCDDYLHVQNVSELEKMICEDKHIDQIIRENYSSDKKLLIFFDSLDAVSRNSRAFEIFKRFLKQLWGTAKIKTVCTVRSYDYWHSHSIKSTEWGENFELDKLSYGQLKHALSYLNCTDISEKLVPVLRNPLNLKLLSLILKKSGLSNLNSITSEIDLYNEHWKEYVGGSKDSAKLKKVLFHVSKDMIEKQRISVPVPDDCAHDALKLALSRGLLKNNENTTTVEFFHHAYLDYVVSRYVLEEFETLDKFLIQEKYNVFLRPTVVFTFSMLRIQDEARFLKNVQKILSSSEIKHYWKLSVLHVFRDFKTAAPSEVNTIGKLFDEDLALRQSFLREATESKNSFWFEIWKDYLRRWADEPHTYNDPLLNYLKSILPDADHQELFAILQTIVEKNKHEWTRKTAVEFAAILNVEKNNWYLKLSTDKNSYVRWGVIESMSSLIDTKTKNLHKIFSNVFLFKENSSDPTVLRSGNSLVLQSNMKQDNMMVVWNAGEKFAKFLKKHPSEFLLSVVTIMEHRRKHRLNRAGTVIDDGELAWYGGALSDERKLLLHTENFLNTCEVSRLRDLIPILTMSNLSSLHKIAIDAMLNHVNHFKDEVFSELSIPEVYNINTLEETIKHAIGEVYPHLSKIQMQLISKLIMESKPPVYRQHGETTQVATNRAKARLLSSIPSEKTTAEQKKLISDYPEEKMNAPPSGSFYESYKPINESSNEVRTIEEIIDLSLTQKLNLSQKMEFLNAVYKYLDPQEKDLDASRLSQLQAFFLSEGLNEYSQENSNVKDLLPLSQNNAVREIVPACLIRLYYHTADEKLVKSIEKLADDDVSTVRAEVGYELRYLYAVNPTLALRIIRKYSMEPDVKTHFCLTDVVGIIATKYAQEAADIINSIFETDKSNNYQSCRHYSEILVYLSLTKQNSVAKSLLNNLITKPDYPSSCKESLPFILKSYLQNEFTQNAALKIFSELLSNEDPEVREKAVFFLLVTLQDDISEKQQVIGKIRPHLDKIAKETERKPYHLRIIESLIEFLKRNWVYIQADSVRYLQMVADSGKALEFRPWIANGVIEILNGLFREGMLDNENKHRCLDVLDIFARAGWPQALELLNIMQRPD